MKKDTSKLLEELSGFSSFRDYYERNADNIASIPLSGYLSGLIEQKGLIRSEVIARAEMSEVYGYQILSGVRSNPKREKVLCLAFGMKLTFEETQEMLKKTGYAPLYVKDPSDCIVIYGLFKGMSVPEVNQLLYEYGEDTLG